MTASTTSRVPAGRTGWPILRTPKWMFAGAIVLVGGLVLAAWPSHPSTAQRAADLRGMIADVHLDIESCAGGVTDSLTALKAIQNGSSTDVAMAQKIARTASDNCAPGNNMQMEDLVQYQVHESLAAFHLDQAVNDMVTWAFPLAQRVQMDAGALAAARGPAAIANATARLRKDQRALDAERTVIDKAFDTASRALDAHVAPPALPG
jgi:hypothetical protein